MFGKLKRKQINDFNLLEPAYDASIDVYVKKYASCSSIYGCNECGKYKERK